MTLNELQISIPKSALAEIVELFVPANTPSFSVLQMTLTLPDRGVNIRELSAYLSLIDRVYGRLSENGLYSYSHRRDEQLEYAEVREGSWQIVFTEDLTPSATQRFVLLYLLLKFLPHIQPDAAEAAYHRYIRQSVGYNGDKSLDNRKQLRSWMPTDPVLSKMDGKRLTQLVNYLDSIYAVEAHRLSAPHRFAISSVQQVNLAVETQWPIDDPNAYPLRGSVIEYNDPFEPVALEDWSVLQ